MANVDAAEGLKPACYLNGAPYNGQAEVFETLAGDASIIQIGDPVKLGGTSLTGNPTATLAAAGDVMVGVCVGVIPTNRDSAIYREASSTTQVLVATDPQILFEVQEDSDTSIVALAQIGLNFTLITAAGSTITGYSGWELDSSTGATTNTLDVQLVRAPDRADNELAASYAKWLVRLNNHQYVDGTTGV
jgi:hypothetical protein